MPKPLIGDPDRRAAWSPKLTHPAFDANRVRKLDPRLTGFQVAVVNKLQARYREAVAEGYLLERVVPEELFRVVCEWPLMPLWHDGLGLVELRPYHDLTVFRLVTKREMTLLLKTFRVDGVRINRRIALPALFSMRRLGVWGHSLWRYFYDFKVPVRDGRVAGFYLLVL